MWQRFSEGARKVLFYAQQEAGRLGEPNVSCEHLLLGIVRENDSVASSLLNSMGVSLGAIRSEIERQVTCGEIKGTSKDMQLTPDAKRVIDYAYDEAKELNHKYICTEHLLIGVVREGSGILGSVLTKMGVDLDRTRLAVRTLQPERPKESFFTKRSVTMSQGMTNAVEFAIDEAKQQRKEGAEKAVETEHLLIGLLREGEGKGARVLSRLGVDIFKVRKELAALSVDGEPSAGGE